MTATDPITSGVESKGLKGGSLGLVSSIVMGVASTAPAYSLAASLGSSLRAAARSSQG